MEGAVIGSYRVLRKLGEGGMGAVYLAEHSLLGRRAAVKVLQPTLSRNQDIVQRFFNEARAATAIADPGIVQIFDFGYHTDGSAYIVMEFLEGEPLDSRIKRLGRLEPVDALRILRQVSSSLASAHSRGIIHRDLKPENIFLVVDREVAYGERAKLLDFGIAKLTGDTESKVKTATAAIMGTPMYMSPEQCRGAGHVDHRSDLYSLGCVLYQMLVGRTPFDGEGVGEIIACHLREPAPAPSAAVPGLPAEVDGMALRLMAKDPGERYQSAAELSDAIGMLIGVTSPPQVLMPSGGYAAVPGSPTTLSGSARNLAAGASSVAPSMSGQRKSKVGLIAGAIAGVAIATTVTVVVASGGGGGGSKAGGASGSAPAATTSAGAATAAGAASAPGSTATVTVTGGSGTGPATTGTEPGGATAGSTGSTVEPTGSAPGRTTTTGATTGATAGSAPTGATTGSAAVATAPEPAPATGGNKSGTRKTRPDKPDRTKPDTTSKPAGTASEPVKPPPRSGVPGDLDGDGIPDERLQ